MRRRGTTGAAAPTVGAASGAAAQLAQLVLGLGLVIGLIFLLAWLVRRVQQAGPRGNRLIRTLASQPLGRATGWCWCRSVRSRSCSA